jgi:hypothetical protein
MRVVMVGVEFRQTQQGLPFLQKRRLRLVWVSGVSSSSIPPHFRSHQTQTTTHATARLPVCRFSKVSGLGCYIITANTTSTAGGCVHVACNASPASRE